MLRFLASRVLQAIPTLIGVALLAFLLIRQAPGDPVEARIGERGITPERLAALRADMGLDQPLWRQFADYLSAVASGDFGVSLATRNPVLDEFLTLFPATIELTLAAVLLGAALGLPLGALAAVKRGGWLDHGVMGLSLTGYSMPVFWWGLLLILLFSVNLGWTPVSGRLGLMFYVEPVTGFLLIDALWAGDYPAFTDALRHLILPAAALGTIPLAVIARMTRSAMLEALGEDYIRAARARGLGELRVVGLHALRNAMIPVATVIGLQVGTLLGGAILTETIFAWPGVGKWLMESIHRRDYPALQGGALLIAMAVIAVNLAVDALYGVLDPRIRHGGRY